MRRAPLESFSRLQNEMGTAEGIGIMLFMIGRTEFAALFCHPFKSLL